MVVITSTPGGSLSLVNRDIVLRLSTDSSIEQGRDLVTSMVNDVSAICKPFFKNEKVFSEE